LAVLRLLDIFELTDLVGLNLGDAPALQTLGGPFHISIFDCVFGFFQNKDQPRLDQNEYAKTDSEKPGIESVRFPSTLKIFDFVVEKSLLIDAHGGPDLSGGSISASNVDDGANNPENEK